MEISKINSILRVVLCFCCVVNTQCQSRKGALKTDDMPDIAFVHANLIPMDKDTIYSNQTLIVQDGKISDMGPFADTSIPKGLQIVDATGLFVMPGFIDMHVHLSDDADMLRFVQHGVTTIRNMSDVPWWTRMMGFSNILKLREKQRNRKMIGPDIYTCGYTLDGSPPVSPMNTRITSAKDAALEVAQEEKKGYDAIKLYDNLSSEAYKAIVQEARKAGIPVAGHVPHAVPLAVLLKDKLVSMEHLSGYIDNKKADYIIPKHELDRHIELNRQSGIYNVPTLTVWACMPPENGIDSLRNTPKYRALSWHVRWMWKTALPYYYDISYPDKKGYTQHMLAITKDLTYKLYKAGCPLLIGTDTNIAGTYAGEATHLEMQLFVDAGIPVFETLRSATILPAMALGKSSEIGTLEVGKKANLVFLRENPLNNIKNTRSVRMVYCNGFLVSLSESR